MAAAIFALAGALIGVLGAFAIEWVRARAENLRRRQEALQLACADFMMAIARMWNLYVELKPEPVDAQLNSFYGAHREARINYERLRLTAASSRVQEAARYVLRYAYGLVRETEGKAPREDEKERGPLMMLMDKLPELVAAVRNEIGVPHPDDVYKEPDKWMEKDL
jgi:hypothetical protein